MNKKEYYKLMENLDPKESYDFKVIHKNWFKCFDYILRSFEVGHNTKTIRSLFLDFDMENWTALHLKNTEYKDYTQKKLIDAFIGECAYIYDRTSYDRLFRTHWLFKQAFHKKLLEVKYPELK